MSGGISDTGFVPKTIEEIKGEIEAEQLGTVDPALDLSEDQPLGQINGIFAKKAAEIWELCATLYHAYDPSAAEGDLLDNVCLITGTLRQPAKASRVPLTCSLNAAVTIPAGAMVAVLNQPQILFELDPVTYPSGFTSTTAGNYDLQFVCTQTGPVVANAGTLTVIVTTVSGWNSCTNALDAVIGANIEQDTPLRLRRQDELSASGAGTVDSIRADLLELTGMIQALVFENTTLVTDGTGLPGKAIECVVWDGATPAVADADIAAAIWKDKPSGIQTYGTTSHDTTDSLGTSRTVYFSRATSVPVYLDYTIVTDPRKFPADGVTRLKTAIETVGQQLQLEDSVVAVEFEALPLSLFSGVPGVTDVSAFHLGTSPSPTGTTNIPITGRQIASIDTSRITITVT